MQPNKLEQMQLRQMQLRQIQLRQMQLRNRTVILCQRHNKQNLHLNSPLIHSKRTNTLNNLITLKTLKT